MKGPFCLLGLIEAHVAVRGYALLMRDTRRSPRTSLPYL